MKLYDDILNDTNLTLDEAVLLCMYISKYIQFKGYVIACDSSDANYLKIDRHHVSKKRKHLEELGYIKCKMQKGKPSIVQLNESILEKLEITIYK